VYNVVKDLTLYVILFPLDFKVVESPRLKSFAQPDFLPQERAFSEPPCQELPLDAPGEPKVDYFGTPTFVFPVFTLYK